MSSAAARMGGVVGWAAYAASKGALNTMTQSLARALAPLIRVNTVCPGYIDTPWFTKGRGEAGAKAVRDAGYSDFDAFTPFPSEELAEVLDIHHNRLPLLVLIGGILGVLLIAYLWTPNFSQPGRSGIVLAVVFAVLLYLGVLVHELAHAWAARAFGYPVHGITLWLLGGYTVYERRTSRPWPELVIAVIGPVSTLLLEIGRAHV